MAVDRPPPAPSVPVTEVLHGVTVPDPYRNLEDLSNPATREWILAEGAYAERELARIDVRAELTKRIRELMSSSGDDVRDIRRMPGGRIFYLARKRGESQFKLVVRDGVSGRERVLVDPQVSNRATGTPHAINHFSPSWDGRRVAYGVSKGGSEDAALYVMEVGSGTLLGPPIPRVIDGAQWAPDNRHLTYTQLHELQDDGAATEKYLDATVFLIDCERMNAPARPLFGPLVNKDLGLARLDFAQMLFSPDSRWMVARTTDTTVPEGKVFVAPVASLGADNIFWRPVSSAADKITDVQLRRDTLYLLTYADAPRRRVLALPLTDPVLARAKVVVPEPKVGVLDSFQLGSDAIYSEVLAGFNARVRRHADGRIDDGEDIARAHPGSMYLIADPAHAYRDPWVVTRTWTDPPRAVAVGANGAARDTGLLHAKRPAGVPPLEVSEVMIPSHDGVKVPLTIIRRKGLAQDGRNPTLLTGYAAYGMTITPWYDKASLAWLERGGVVAYVNPRGSGAFGNDWYRAGFKATKPNTWKDGIAAARYLIEQGFASPATLGVQGTSAGGIFAGRVATSAPELFAAAIWVVGLLDAVRAEESANGITNVSEFGSVRNADEFPAVLEMSTYHHIVDGVKYPAVMLVHGMNDPRVDVWHSAKAAARLQGANPKGKPVLLRLDRHAGHGIGNTLDQQASQRADIYSFLLWQFGRANGVP